MRRILFCPPLYPPSLGGSAALFSDLAHLWAAGEGRASIVYTTSPDPGLAAIDPAATSPGFRPLQDGPVPVRRFGLIASGRPRLRGRLLGSASRWGPMGWRTATGFPHILVRGYRRFLRRHAQQKDGPFHLVVAGVLPHNHFLEPAVRFARRQGLPLLAIPLLHTALLGTRPRDQVLGPCAGRLLRRARRVAAMTPSEVSTLDRLGIPAEKIRVAGAGLQLDPLPGADPCSSPHLDLPAPYLLQAGTLSADKGTMTLLAAHALQIARGRRQNLVLMGQADRHVLLAVRSLPPAACQRVFLIHTPGRPEWNAVLAGATALVHPTRADSLGLVILEAWRAGVPVVVARAGGPAHLVHHDEDGLMVPPGDPAALAAALERLEQSPALAARLGSAGRRCFQRHHTWPVLLPRWMDLFREAMCG
ncbi:MAG: glycosyltransferase family 4 protein [Acidobacteriota bacterium]